MLLIGPPGTTNTAGAALGVPVGVGREGLVSQSSTSLRQVIAKSGTQTIFRLALRWGTGDTIPIRAGGGCESGHVPRNPGHKPYFGSRCGQTGDTTPIRAGRERESGHVPTNPGHKPYSACGDFRRHAVENRGQP